MLIYLENHLEMPIHVAVISTPPKSIEFVISEAPIPPIEGMTQHFDLDTKQAVRLWNMPDKVDITVGYRGKFFKKLHYKGEHGNTADGTLLVRIEVHIPEPPPPHLRN